MRMMFCLLTYCTKSRQMCAVTYDLNVGDLFDEYNSLMNYSHFINHTQETIDSMIVTIQAFKIQVEKQLYEYSSTDFTTSKYHLLEHYPAQILRFGSLLNGDTDTTEGIHPMVKRAYRNTNKKGMIHAHHTFESKALLLDDYTSQIARNLDYHLMTTALHNKLIGGKLKKPLNKHKLGSLVKNDRAKKLLPHHERLCLWITLNHEHEFKVLTDIKTCLRFAIYQCIQCVYTDVNNPEKDINKLARANPKWSHRDSDELYDYVVVANLGPPQEGLNGVRLGRLHLLTKCTPNSNQDNVREDYEVSLAVVQLLTRVETHNEYEILPVFQKTNEYEVIETNRIVRTAHMVQEWNSKITDLTDSVAVRSKDPLDEYDRMVWNIHSDTQAWNTYSMEQ